MEEKYVKLKKQNNWGNYYYEKVEDIEKSLMGIIKRENLTLLFKEGQEIKVKWPNGEVTRERITMKRYTEKINDMGREYTLDGEIPRIKLSIRGIEAIVDNFERLEFANSDLIYQKKPSFVK
jgi:hypothetical protein